MPVVNKIKPFEDGNCTTHGKVLRESCKHSANIEADNRCLSWFVEGQNWTRAEQVRSVQKKALSFDSVNSMCFR